MILNLETVSQKLKQANTLADDGFSWVARKTPERIVSPEQVCPKTAAEEFTYWLGGSWIRPIPLDSFFKFHLKSRERTEPENKTFIYLTQYLVEELIDVLANFEANQSSQGAKLHLETAAGRAYLFLGGNTGREMFGERKQDIHESTVRALRGMEQPPFSPRLSERIKNYQPNCDIRMLVPAADQAKLAEVIQTKFASELSDLKLVSLRPGFSMVVGSHASFFNFDTQTYTKTTVYFIMLDPNISLEDDWRIGPQFSDDQRRFLPYGLDENKQKTAFQSHRLMHSERIYSIEPAKIDKPQYKSPLRILNAVSRMIIPKAYQFQDEKPLFRLIDNQTVANLRGEVKRIISENTWEDDSWHEPEVEAQLAVCAYFAPKLTIKLLIAIGWLSGPLGLSSDTSLPDYDWQSNPVAEAVLAEFLRLKKAVPHFTADQNWLLVKKSLQNLRISPIIQRDPDKFLL